MLFTYGIGPTEYSDNPAEELGRDGPYRYSASKAHKYKRAPTGFLDSLGSRKLSYLVGSGTGYQ